MEPNSIFPTLTCLNVNWSSSKLLTAVTIASLLALSGCSTIEHKPKGFLTEPALDYCDKKVLHNKINPRKIAIFFDGTANDEGSDTNVKRLHSLVSLQNRANIATLYIQGVGVGFDGIGAITGGGINARVKIAYEFILNHYRPTSCAGPADEVYIFGFSRGAYSARILTTMLYYGGLVASREKPYYTSTELTERVHDTTFGPVFGEIQQASRLRQVRDSFGDKKSGVITLPTDGKILPIQVKVLGLWDTVEALGPEFLIPTPISVGLRSSYPKVEIDIPNKRYGERLCNVKFAYHAMSIDDNRATIFTPLLLTRQHLFSDCPPGADEDDTTGKFHSPMLDNSGNIYSPMLDSKGNIRKNHLKEVWFAGAHSDVGGGYLNSSLSGVSLNWMIEQLEGESLLPNSAKVREDAFGSSNNPASGAWYFLYPDVNRNIASYMLDYSNNNVTTKNPEKYMYEVEAPRKEFVGSICMHSSVFQRRRMVETKKHENSQLLLQSPGQASLETKLYGKGRSWLWLAESKGDAGIGLVKLEVQKYPECNNIEPQSHDVESMK